MPNSEGRRPSRPAAKIKASEQNENTRKKTEKAIDNIFFPRGGLNIIQKLIANFSTSYLTIRSTYEEITSRVDISEIPDGDKIKLLILRSIVAKLDTNRKELKAILQGIKQDIGDYKNPIIEKMIDKKVSDAFDENEDELAFVLNRSSEKLSSESGETLTLVSPDKFNPNTNKEGDIHGYYNLTDAMNKGLTKIYPLKNMTENAKRKPEIHTSRRNTPRIRKTSNKGGKKTRKTRK